MATKQDKSKSHPDQNSPAESATPRTASPTSRASDSAPDLLPDAVVQAIDDGRVQLMQAHAVLKCLHEVLLYAEGEDAQYCAESANVVAKLLDDVVGRLDPTNLRRALRRATRDADDRVEEPALLYYGSVELQPRESLRLRDVAAEHNIA